MKYAEVIVDISAEAVDSFFTYRIPEELEGKISRGVRVNVPFGNMKKGRTAFVIAVKDEAGFDESKIKDINGILEKSVKAESDILELAGFISDEYGCTMNQALKTVLPVKKNVRKNSRRTDPVEVINSLSEENEDIHKGEESFLNEAQKKVSESILAGDDRPSLLYGITGSGKTRVYIDLIRKMRAMNKQSIVLIPEISLTYQTVRELSYYLGSNIAVMHSKLSEGERYEQFKKASLGQIDVCVGPRSALFTPFSNLGLIIIDEEHERTYRSDTTPRYDSREVAKKRAELSNAKLVLGSATPSLESYKKALNGEYNLYRLDERAVKGAVLPKIHISDMRKELESGNKSVFSEKLKELISDRLSKGEQTMLFLNRRGYAGFVSCRSCGKVIKCPHCDVSLTVHNDWYIDKRTGKKQSALLSCHYCGFQAPMPKQCPDCGSKYIAPFGTGTQKLEQLTKKEFPNAKILRMDADSTQKKGAHEKILSQFAGHKADILIGTQMIVKGHDFPFVTLVGIVAADMSLYSPEFDASERTYQLLTQAAGRAGRGQKSGDVVIQSYDPSHYAIVCASERSYDDFYEREESYRKLLKYPPECFLLTIRLRSEDEQLLNDLSIELQKACENAYKPFGAEIIGPCNEPVYRVNEQFRKVLFIKHPQRKGIRIIRTELEKYIKEKNSPQKITAGFEVR